MGNNHVTKLEIDLNAINDNLDYFKSKLLASTKIMVVVKAFGYGSSAVAVATLLASKVNYFAVAYVDEGIALRNAGIKTPILVLHPQKINLNKIIDYDLEPNIYCLSILQEFLNILNSRQQKAFPIHIKFNTGLNRLGFSQNDIPVIARLLNNQKAIHVASVFSHIAASEDPKELDFTIHQATLFNNCAKELANKLNITPFKHLLNTSGIINYSTEYQLDMIRLGIGLYGFGNESNETKKLKNVVQLKSVISQIHTIEKGDSVGYNRAFKANSSLKTATIPIGHADGISRQFGNGVGYVFIHGKKAPIIGNVCMDMLMANVTSIDCSEGDTVVIYKDQEHMENLANAINTIPYELLTAISQRVKRVITS